MGGQEPVLGWVIAKVFAKLDSLRLLISGRRQASGRTREQKA
jgi:hypothetical protein